VGDPVGKLQVLQAMVDVTPGANGRILQGIAKPAPPSCDLAYTYLINLMMENHRSSWLARMAKTPEKTSEAVSAIFPTNSESAETDEVPNIHSYLVNLSHFQCLLTKTF